VTTMTPRRIPEGTTDRVLAQLFPEPSPWIDDPAGWVEAALHEEFWSRQEEIAASVLEHRYTAVPSCHDSGKSYTASRVMSWWIDSHEPGEAFVVSTAPSQTQVEAILWREVGRAHRKGDLIGRITYGMVPQWKIGPEIVGFGRKPQDLKSKEEAMAAFQGIHARYVLIVIDEAGGVPKWLFDAVDTLATNESARVLAIGNPDDPASQFEKICRPGSGWNVLPISAFDTPNFTDEEVDEDVAEQLISRTWVEERKKRWGESSPLYISKVLGQFPDVSDDTLISPALIKAACELELPGRELGQYGCDISRGGEAETAIYRNRGGCIRLEEIRQGTATKDLTKTSGLIVRLVGRHKGKSAAIIDADGLGGGVYDNVRAENVPCVEFRNGSKAHDHKDFVNRRSEVFWILRELMEEGAIDLDPLDEDALAQLGSIMWFTDKKGRIKVESKEEMLERGLPSPDRADAIMMSVCPRTIWPDELVPDRNRREDTADKPLTAGLMDREL
jgi:hypothetical protein